MAGPRHENVSTYRIDESLARSSLVYVTVKGFNQQAIVAKIIERKGKKSLGLTAVENTSQRRYSSGKILFTDLDIEAFTDEAIETGDAIDSVEPYHLAFSGDLLAYTAGDRLEVVGPDGKRTLTNDWMAYLHTADFSTDRQRVLVVSTGFDTIQELDLASGTGEPIWDWNGWDHGITYSETAGRHYVRTKAEADRITAEDPGATVVLVENPRDWPREGLATQETPLNMNGVFYGAGPVGAEQILATGYHRSDLFVIDREAGFTQYELGLSHPHSFRAVSSASLDDAGQEALGFDYRYMVSNTGAGQLLLLGDDFSINTVVDFGSLPADADKQAGFGEWLQTVAFLDESTGLVAAVDALRDGVHVIDLVGRRRRFIPNPPTWTIQTVSGISPGQVREMLGTAG